jgi:hypothetical protein
MRCQRLLSWLLQTGCILLALFATTGLAGAHPQAAQTPVFVAPSDCVTVVDKRTAATFNVSYTLPFDDTEITFGDIPVSDAKTHQFFAFSSAIHNAALQIEAYSFDATRAPHVIPEWISVDDVMRAAQAAPGAQGVVFSESTVPADTVLENDGALAGLWRPITFVTQRVPITMAQASRGATWDLTAVPGGLYTVAGYVFSPPYNGWSLRPGLVKVLDGGLEPPALVIEPINEFVFQYQGRRVGLCANVPNATRLTASFRVVSQPGSEWTPFVLDQPVSSGRSELCFRAPAGVAGEIRMRFDLRTPDGTSASFYSPDALTALVGDGRCSAQGTICCDFAASAGQGGAGGSGPSVAGAASVAAMPTQQTSGGCGVAAMPTPPGRTAAGVWFGALLLLKRKRQNRTRPSGCRGRQG